MYKIKEGFNIIKKAMGFVFKHPKGLFPFFLAWALNLWVGFIVYSNVDFDTKSDTEKVLIVFGLTIVFTALVSISSLILLELVEQHETRGRMSLLKAIYDALVKDLYRAIPVIIVWAIVKFLIMILKSALSSKSKNGSSRRSSYSSRRADRFLDTLQTGARMAMFIVLPAIAWEPVSPMEAAKKGMDVYKNHLVHMLTGLYLSKILGFITFVPALIVFVLAVQLQLFSTGLIIGLVIYIGLTWSFGMMVEQLYTAELYIWYKKFEDEKAKAEYEGTEQPQSMKDVKRPSIFDDLPDFSDNQYAAALGHGYEKPKREKY